jgi:hypothetical protein
MGVAHEAEEAREAHADEGDDAEATSGVVTVARSLGQPEAAEARLPKVVDSLSLVLDAGTRALISMASVRSGWAAPLRVLLNRPSRLASCAPRAP